MIAPAWLLLFWSALGASCAAAVAATLIGGVRSGSWSLAPRPQSRMHAFGWSAVAGLLAYPAVYGLVFEALSRADVRLGLIMGAIHGIIAFSMAEPRRALRSAFRTGFAHVVYGVIIAFLYVTP